MAQRLVDKKAEKPTAEKARCHRCGVLTSSGSVVDASRCSWMSQAAFAFDRAGEVPWPGCAPVWHRMAQPEKVGERALLWSSAASEMPLGSGGSERHRIPGSNPQGTSISTSNCFLMAQELSKGNCTTVWFCISFYLSF